MGNNGQKAIRTLRKDINYMSSVSCVVLNYNDSKTTVLMVNSILLYKNINNIIVVDNHSTDDSLEVLKEELSHNNRITLLISNENGGYGSGNNIGILYSVNELKSDYIVIANPDVIFTDDCIGAMVNVLDNDETIGVVSAVQKNSKGYIAKNFAWNLLTKRQFTLSFSRLFWNRVKKHSLSVNDIASGNAATVDCVGGAMLMLRKEIVDKDGVYDPNIFLYCEETVLAIKVKQKGYITKVLCKENYVHNHSVTIDKFYHSKSKQRKLMRKSGFLVLKKYYNASPFYLFFVRLFFLYCKIETALIDAFDLVFRKKEAIK